MDTVHPGIDVDAMFLHSDSLAADNGPFVADPQRYFGLVWEHKSQSPSALSSHS